MVDKVKLNELVAQFAHGDPPGDASGRGDAVPQGRHHDFGGVRGAPGSPAHGAGVPQPTRRARVGENGGRTACGKRKPSPAVSSTRRSARRKIAGITPMPMPCVRSGIWSETWRPPRVPSVRVSTCWRDQPWRPGATLLCHLRRILRRRSQPRPSPADRCGMGLWPRSGSFPVGDEESPRRRRPRDSVSVIQACRLLRARQARLGGTEFGRLGGNGAWNDWRWLQR